MAGQKTLSLLIVLLSIACTLGKSVVENSQNEVEPSKDQQKSKEQLLVYTFNNFKDIALQYVNEAQNISKYILKDVTLLGYKDSVEIEGFKKNLTDFVDKYKKYQEIEELFDIVDVFAKATEFYMKLTNEAITSDKAVIIATLEKYGSDTLEKKYDQVFIDFMEKFKHQFEETKGFLKEEKDMLEWFANFKTLTNVDEQIVAFEKFFAFY